MKNKTIFRIWAEAKGYKSPEKVWLKMQASGSLIRMSTIYRWWYEHYNPHSVMESAIIDCFGDAPKREGV